MGLFVNVGLFICITSGYFIRDFSEKISVNGQYGSLCNTRNVHDKPRSIILLWRFHLPLSPRFFGNLGSRFPVFSI